MKRITVNVGFITNSSSVVHCFPKELLEDPDVKAFMEAYGISGGYVGSELWYRSECDSFLVTKEQYDLAQARLNAEGYEDYGAPSLGDPETHVTIIYGDEYQSVTSEFCHILLKAARKAGVETWGTEYN